MNSKNHSFQLIFTGDSAELWVTLNAMGYDYNLVQDEAALFKVLFDFQPVIHRHVCVVITTIFSCYFKLLI